MFGVRHQNKAPMLTLKKKKSSLSDTSDTMEDMSLSDDSVSQPVSQSLRQQNVITPSPDALGDDGMITNLPFSTEGGFFGGAPVIGVLSQPRICAETEETEFVIAASYVKWLESAGARALPIPWDATEEMTRAIFPHINGVLFPGGNSILPISARVLWELANEANAKGDFFPIWGTCLGYEYLLMLASGKDEFVMECGYDSHNVSWPVTLTSDESDLYSSPNMRDIVANQPVTMNNHELGIKPDTFLSYPGLVDSFRVTSVNLDCKGAPFVSTIESTDPEQFPYFGVQYHPEKNAYEYATIPGTNTPFENINHSADAHYFSFQLASFFVSLARKNLCRGKHSYAGWESFPLMIDYELRRGVKFQQYYVIPAVGKAKATSQGNAAVPFLGKDHSWRLDLFLGIYKEQHTDE